jgi:hypothetical protein
MLSKLCHQLACLQKYNGACATSREAFSAFFQERGITMDEDSLPPSIRIFFENFDLTTDNGFENPFPIQLKAIHVHALPVDELPNIEIYHEEALVYSSLDEANQKNDWRNEAGRLIVDKPICGDFVITCRFGGEHAWQRDASTLIFIYQNSTAFLPAETVRLKKKHVDIRNQEHKDGIESEYFAVDLLFEPLDDDNPALGLPENILYDCEAFLSGLRFLAKMHVVQPSEKLLKQMRKAGYSEPFDHVGLQLAQNNFQQVVHAVRICTCSERSAL